MGKSYPMMYPFHGTNGIHKNQLNVGKHIPVPWMVWDMAENDWFRSYIEVMCFEGIGEPWGKDQISGDFCFNWAEAIN